MKRLGTMMAANAGRQSLQGRPFDLPNGTKQCVHGGTYSPHLVLSIVQRPLQQLPLAGGLVHLLLQCICLVFLHEQLLDFAAAPICQPLRLLCHCLQPAELQARRTVSRQQASKSLKSQAGAMV
jgi:hypothetical protein